MNELPKGLTVYEGCFRYLRVVNRSRKAKFARFARCAVKQLPAHKPCNIVNYAVHNFSQGIGVVINSFPL